MQVSIQPTVGKQFGVRTGVHHVQVEEGLSQAAAPTDLDPAQVGITAVAGNQNLAGVT